MKIFQENFFPHKVFKNKNGGGGGIGLTHFFLFPQNTNIENIVKIWRKTIFKFF